MASYTRAARYLTSGCIFALLAGCSGSGMMPVPANVAVIAGDEQQSAAPGSALAVAPAVRVTDLEGNPVPSVTVSFIATPNEGSVEFTTAVMGSDGQASSGSWTMPATKGSEHLTASVAGVPRSMTFSAQSLVTTPGFTVSQTLYTRAASLRIPFR